MKRPRRLGFLGSLVVLAAGIAAEPTALEAVRADFLAARGEPSTLPRAVDRLEMRFFGSPRSWPPAVQAYYASLIALQGKYAPSLSDKARLVMSALDVMKGLVEVAPDDIDVRFLRFSLYRELPFFLGLHHLVKPDLAILIALLERRVYGSTPEAFQRLIVGYVLLSGEADAGQTTRLQRLLASP